MHHPCGLAPPRSVFPLNLYVIGNLGSETRCVKTLRAMPVAMRFAGGHRIALGLFGPLFESARQGFPKGFNPYTTQDGQSGNTCQPVACKRLPAF